MTEYTSLGVSRRLKEAGFKKEIDGYPCDAIYMGKYAWALDTSFVEQYAGAKLAEYPAYHTGTLLAWLMMRGDFARLSYDTFFTIVYYPKGLEEPIEIHNGKALPDALAEIVIRMLRHD